MADFKNLIVWQRVHALNLRVTRVATGIRGAAFLTLRSQMVRAAQSIPANIVEGRRQITDRGFAKFLRISVNSGSELEYHLLTARDLGAITSSDFEQIITDLEEVQKMLYGLLRRLATAPIPTPTKSG